MLYKYISLSLLFLGLCSACSDDVKKLEEWAEWSIASNPIVESCVISTPSGTLSAIVGDKITLDLRLADKVNELDAVEIVGTIGNVTCLKQTEFLTGNEATVTVKLQAPWIANLNDGQKLKLKVNVSNDKNGTASLELEDDKCVTVHRPGAFDKLYLVDDQDKVVELARVAESDNYESLSPGAIATSFRIAQKLTEARKVDYSGYVWGTKNGQTALISSENKTGFVVTSTIAQALKTIRFNTNSFAISNTLSLTINGVELSPSEYSNFIIAKFELINNQELTFKGFENLNRVIQPDFFTYLSADKARFNGPDGEYSILYNQKNGFLYIEKLGTMYPDVLWLCGSNFGAPQGNVVTTKPGDNVWAWDDPGCYSYCLKVADNVFETTLYLGSFKFKFFKGRGWGNEEVTGIGIALSPADIYAHGTAANWNEGDFMPGPNFTPGVYRIRIDLNARTSTLTKVQ